MDSRFNHAGMTLLKADPNRIDIKVVKGISDVVKKKLFSGTEVDAVKDCIYEEPSF